MGRVEFRHEKIHIHSIRTLESKINFSQHDDEAGYKTEVSVHQGIILEQSLVQILLNLRVFKDSVQGENNVGTYVLEYLFFIEGLDDWLIEGKENEGIVIDDYLIATLRGLAYSTTRGIIFQGNMGTSMMGVILPVINPSKIEVVT